MDQCDFAKKAPVPDDAKRRWYMEQGLARTERFQAIRRKIETPAVTASAISAIAGTLMTAAGVNSLIAWGSAAAGLGLTIPGIAALALAYPIYKGLVRRGKKKFAQEMTALSSGRMGGEEGKP